MTALAGTVVGFIDNAKPNFNHLVDDLAELLVQPLRREQVHQAAESARRRCRRRMMCIKEFAEQCDLVITGSGD